MNDDEFFPYFRLKNGWVVDTVDFRITYEGGGGGAYVKESHVGTNSPHILIHWWFDAFATLD